MSSPNSDLTPYSGNCHCGAVTFTVQTSSLLDDKVDATVPSAAAMATCISTRNEQRLISMLDMTIWSHTSLATSRGLTNSARLVAVACWLISRGKTYWP
ncbi:hypothetical protein PILCRDRAFT_821851 [Piloderma croceum F 1598]|uniref:CENP-V/GFA domain-containing protein n=1 Tax=Piloderma croceum (strain F 1598) TaxID=765440 RepID=A0A0C3B461_PILCF|nr:hypothetical protein PILCRDRAFT_821851 [Piloderma croceum F 1598]